MRADNWRWSLLAREATRNVFGRGSRLLPLLIASVILGLGQVAFAALETQNLQNVLSDLDARGRNVVVFAAADPEIPVSIGRASCESLTGAPGVLRAGLLSEGERHDIVPLGSGITVLRASATLFPALEDYDALIGSSFGSSPPRILLETDGALTAEANPHQPEGLNANASVIVPLPADQEAAPLCVLITDEFTDPLTTARTAQTQLAVQGGDLTGAPVLRLSTDPVADFTHRLTQYLPLLLGLMGALATGILFRLRSGEIATYLLSGTSGRSVAVLLWLESALIAGVGVCSASLATLVLSGGLIDSDSVILRGVLFGATWAVGSAILSTGVAFRRPTDLAKDR